MKLHLCYYGNPILRKKCAPVEAIDDELRELVYSMEETMFTHDGIGIAAPQIGKSIALFLVNAPDEPIHSNDDDDDEDEEQPQQENTPSITEVFINPKILSHSEETWDRGEGCLSIPKVYGRVTRPLHITVEATDLNGNRFTRDYSGLKARTIMHENDHINGVLFIDRIHGKERQELEHYLKQIKKLYSK